MGKGYCYSCGSCNPFLYSYSIESDLDEIASQYQMEKATTDKLLIKENNLCNNCLANLRSRILAESVVHLLGYNNTEDLIQYLKKNKQFYIYEAAAYSIFRSEKIKKIGNYIVSEYSEEHLPGELIKGILNENLECLTFSDNSFDVVITSEVLEHVSDLNRALIEIKRVLKKGGYHIFTIPVDFEAATTFERVRKVGTSIEFLAPPIHHGDSIRANGILVFRDFGRDVLEYLSIDGFTCTELRCFDQNKHLLSVYYAQKNIC